LYREFCDPMPLSLGGPHCWNWVWRPVLAMVILDAPGERRELVEA
jgi:hypothetical protein